MIVGQVEGVRRVSTGGGAAETAGDDITGRDWGGKLPFMMMMMGRVKDISQAIAS